MDFLNVESFPDRHEDSLSPEAENDLYDYYISLSKRPFDWYWNQAQMISGSADVLDSDFGMPIEEKI